MSDRIPLVEYLALEPEPHLVAHECTSCGARYFDRRNACAGCFGTEFRDVERRDDRRAARVHDRVARRARHPGAVRRRRDRLRRHERARQRRSTSTPDPEHVHVGMKVRLTTQSLGADGAGTEAIGFGFEPLRREQLMASDDIWILGIHMTKFGKHPDKDTVDLAAEAAMGALADGGVTMRDMGVLAAGNLMGARPGHRPAAAEADRPDRHPRLQRDRTRARPARPRCAPRSWR